MKTFTEELLCVQLNRKEVQTLNDLFKHWSGKDLNNELNDEESILTSDMIDEFDAFLGY